MPPRHPMFDPLVLEALGRAQDLPAMPAAALEVLRVVRDPEAGARELAAAVSLDPALSVKVLHVANSPLFSGRAEITTLQRACSQMGFNTVKLMALCFALLDSLSRPDLEGFDYDEYWKRSMVRAVAAKLVAESVVPVLAEEAFLTGMLSRIGQLFLARCFSGEYQAVVAESRGNWPSDELERSKLGFSSGELGAALLHAWNLPLLLHEAIFHAQYPYKISEDLPAKTKELAWALSLAAACEKLVCDAGKSESLMELHRLAKDFFALEAETVDGLLSPLDHRTAEVAESLDIKIEEGLDMPEVFREAELELIRGTLSLLHKAVFTEQQAAQLQLENSHLLLKAETDPLTGLANRSTFQETLTSCVAENPRGAGHESVGLLMIDVDHFKKVNDQYGHPVGDRVLQRIARRVREIIRVTDLAARYGGDEFAVLMPKTTSEGLKEAAERIRAAIEGQQPPAAAGEASVTVSIGGVFAEIFDPPMRVEELVEIADRHLYRAKRGGCNQCSVATASAGLGEPVPVRTKPAHAGSYQSES